MELGVIERLKLKLDSERRCHICHFMTPEDIPLEKIHYCGKCGAHLKLDMSDKEQNTYKDYVVIEQKKLDKLENEVYQKQQRIRKLEEELYYLKEVKYGSFWSTIKAAFGFD